MPEQRTPIRGPSCGPTRLLLWHLLFLRRTSARRPGESFFPRFVIEANGPASSFARYFSATPVAIHFGLGGSFGRLDLGETGAIAIMLFDGSLTRARSAFI